MEVEGVFAESCRAQPTILGGPPDSSFYAAREFLGLNVRQYGERKVK